MGSGEKEALNASNLSDTRFMVALAKAKGEPETAELPAVGGGSGVVLPDTSIGTTATLPAAAAAPAV